MAKANFRRRGGGVRRKRVLNRRIRVNKRVGRRRPCRPARRRPNRRRAWYDGNEHTLSTATLTTSTGGSSVGINSPPTDDGGSFVSTTESYLIIKKGIKQSIPAAIVLWAFYKAAPGEGLTSRRVINFITKYRRGDELKKCGMTVGSLLNYAVEFGLLERRGNKYFMVKKDKRGR